ncbi:MAG TPA: hypothetical protein VHA30_04635, partial [Patescibacteria group bacterium]|nr:hypothetical protein [Patescibacteria group bacterium]
YRGKYIFYSLGNFVFDQSWSQDTREGLALKIQISGAAGGNQLQGARPSARLDQIELLPVVIENAQPRPASADEAAAILKKIGQSQTILKP